MIPRPSLRRPPSRRPGQRGFAIVELALVLLPLVLLLAATADLGRAFYTYNTLVKATRGAARHMALSDPFDATTQQEAKNLVLYGDVEKTDQPLVSDLSESMVSVCNTALCADHAVALPGGIAVGLVSVRVTGYAYTSLFSALLPAKLAFSTINATMW